MSAWQEGYQAYFNGGDNPYAPIDPRYLEWQSGCTAGKNGEALFQEGYNAYHNGKRIIDNPHPITAWTEWDAGWEQAAHEEEADLEGYAMGLGYGDE